MRFLLTICAIVTVIGQDTEVTTGETEVTSVEPEVTSGETEVTSGETEVPSDETEQGSDNVEEPIVPEEPPEPIDFSDDIRKASDAHAAAQVEKDGPAEYNWEVAYQNINNVGNSRRMITVNGEFPGPTVRVRQGQRLKVSVFNRIMSQAFSIHFHGIAHRGEGIWYDGASGVNQCPITFGQTFVYDFEVPETQPIGTYFWHAHLGYQRDNGLSGAMIIEPKKEDKIWNGGFPPFCKDLDDPNSVPECLSGEFVIQVQDYNFKQINAASEFTDERPYDGLKTYYQPNDLRSPVKTVLVNGRGKATEELCQVLKDKVNPGARSIEGTDFDENAITCDGDYAPTPYVMEVEQGKTYLVRMLNPGRHIGVDMEWLKHNARLVGNGVSRIKEMNPGRFRINPGERMEFLITADQTPAVYDIKVERFAGFLPISHMQSGFYLKYKSVDLVEANIVQDDDPANRRTPVNRSKKWYDMAIDPAKSRMTAEEARPPPPSEVTRQFTFKISTVILEKDENRWPKSRHVSHVYDAREHFDNGCEDEINEGIAINGVVGSGIEAKYGGTPLAMLAQMGKLDHESDPSMYYAEAGDVVEILFQSQNICGGPSGHAMHLHGYNFWVVAHGAGEYNPVDQALYEKEKIEAGEPYGYKSDIIGMYPDDSWTRGMLTGDLTFQGWALIRYKAVQPGVWPVHCHQSTHNTDLGLRAFMIHSPDKIPPPPKGFPVCGDFAKAAVDEVAKLKAELAALQAQCKEKRPCEDKDALKFHRKPKGRYPTTKSTAETVCECEDICTAVDGAWSFTWLENKDDATKSKCTCYKNKPNKVKTKKGKDYVFVEL